MSIIENNKNTTLQLYSNPLSIQSRALEKLQNTILNGDDVGDGNNVFTFLLEFVATMTSGVAGETLNMFSDLYPSKAITAESLYKHMSDFDYVNLFSKPATTKLTLMFDRNYLINNAVKSLDGDVNYKIIIPSQSTFSVNMVKFGIHYPIEINIKKNILPNGKTDFKSCTFTVLWDLTKYNPLHNVKTNTLEHRFFNSGGRTYFCIDVPVHQFAVTTHNETVSPSTGFIRRYEYSDKFYAIRVFESSGGQWNEIHQTLSNTIYDIYKPTVKVKVMSELNTVEIVIPQMYIGNNQIGNKILVKLYTCNGEINQDISNYNSDQFSASFIVNDEVIDTGYSDMLKYVNFLQVIPTVSTISGGSDGLSFEELRERVIYDSTYDAIITIRDLAAYFKDHGYSTSKYLDNITNRIFLAHKVITDARNNIVGIGDYNTIFDTNILKMHTDTDTNEKFVRHYSDIRPMTKDAFVILPTNIYKYDDTKDSMIILNDREISEFKNLSKTQKINELNDNIYTFSPFHIKIVTQPTPHVLLYDLLRPSISNMTFIDENPNIPTQLSMYSYGIYHADDGSGGYKLYVNLYRTNDIADIHASEVSQNGILKNFLIVLTTSDQNGTPAYTIGQYVGISAETELPMIEFDILTNYNILAGDKLQVTNFTSNSSTTYIPLNSKFTISTFIRSDLITNMNPMKGVNTSTFPKEADNYVWLSTQSIDVKLGERVSMLYSDIAMTLGPADIELQPTTKFVTYTTPIYARYTRDDILNDPGHTEEDFKKVGLLKYPLETVHYPGEIMLTKLFDDVSFPTCILQDYKLSNTIIIDNISEIATNEVAGEYILTNPEATGIDRIWRQLISTDGKVHTEIKYVTDTSDSSVKYWCITKTSRDGTTKNLYRPKSTLSTTYPTENEWIYLPDPSLPSTLKLTRYKDPKLTNYNLRLSEPYTDTSRHYNVWTSSPGYVYLDKCDLEDVNGRYHLTTPTHNTSDRVWIKMYTVNNVITTHKIKYGTITINGVSQSMWHITQQSTGDEEIILINTNNDPTIEPWNNTWTILKDSSLTPPEFNLLNSTSSKYKIVVDDLLSYLTTTAQDNIFEDFEDVQKYIDDDYNVINPTRAMAIFLNSPSIDEQPTNILDEEFIDPDDPYKRAGGTGYNEGALYLRDLEADNFDVNKYLTNAQLQKFFKTYDDSNNKQEAESTLSNKFKLPIHVTRSILKWRTPWIKTLEASDLSTIQKYLDTCEFGLMSLTTLKDMQKQLKSPTPIYPTHTDLISDIDNIEDNTYVWITTLGDDYTAHTSLCPTSHTDNTADSGLILIDKQQDAYHLITRYKDLNDFKLLIDSTPAHHGMMYSIYRQVLNNDYVLLYANFLNNNININSSAWNNIDNWPWEIDDWIDIHNLSTSKFPSITLDTTTSGAIVSKTNEDPIIEDGKILNDNTENRSIVYNTNILHVDYKPTISDEIWHTNYRTHILEILRQHFTTLDSAKVSLLEQTSLYFKPIRTIGSGDFKLLSSSTINMRLDMTMDLRLHVEPHILTDTYVRTSIEENIYSIIAKHLAKGTISQTNISKDILNEMGDSIVYVDVLGINDMPDVQTLIPEDPTCSPYLKQTLYLKEDNTIGVKPGINIKWVSVE